LTIEKVNISSSFNTKWNSMKAMILAAGHGTRLQALTLKMPKPLLPVANKSVIDRSLEYLGNFGVTDVIINAHHLHEMMISYLGNGKSSGLKIQVRVEPEILGTGGGIKNSEDFWDDNPFVVINGDILTDIDLARAFEAHKNEGNLVTMILHDHQPFNQVSMDARGNITEISSRILPDALAFTGIHIMEKEVLRHIPPGQFSCILECYRKLIHDGRQIRGYVTKGHYWRDMGTVENYLLANKENIGALPLLTGRDCHIAQGARINDWAVLGNGTTIEKEVGITGSVLWNDVKVKQGVRIINSIVTSGKEVSHDIQSCIL
jgi:mannose-1-phosphate guanylyltransferase